MMATWGSRLPPIVRRTIRKGAVRPMTCDARQHGDTCVAKGSGRLTLLERAGTDPRPPSEARPPIRLERGSSGNPSRDIRDGNPLPPTPPAARPRGSPRSVTTEGGTCASLCRGAAAQAPARFAANLPTMVCCLIPTVVSSSIQQIRVSWAIGWPISNEMLVVRTEAAVCQQT